MDKDDSSPSKGRCLALLTNIRLDWKCFTEMYTLACSSGASLTTKKFFKTDRRWACRSVEDLYTSAPQDWEREGPAHSLHVRRQGSQRSRSGATVVKLFILLHKRRCWKKLECWSIASFCWRQGIEENRTETDSKIASPGNTEGGSITVL